MASPIQVVLNPENFNGDRKKQGGSEHTDFYADRDSEFRAHKQQITDQLQSVRKMLEDSPYSQVAYAKLVLEQSALAKTHRPTKALFRRDVTPVVGAGDLGELYIQVTPTSINRTLAKVAQAEESTTRKEKASGEVVFAPTRAKSEVGAIKEIKPYTTADKRKFSVAEGLQWLSDSRTGGAYIVELFETPPPRQGWDLLPPEKVKLFQTFVDGLHEIGQGLIASRLSDNFKGYPLMGVKIGTTPEKASVQLSPSNTQTPRKPGSTLLDPDVNKHTRLLDFLDKHPLVKRVVLPPIISQTHTNPATGGTKIDLAAPAKDKKYPKIAIVDGGVSNAVGPWLEKKFDYIADTDKNTNHGTFIAGLLVAGAKMNTTAVCPEFDGCKIIDIDLLPIGACQGSCRSFYAASADLISDRNTAFTTASRSGLSVTAATGVQLRV